MAYTPKTRVDALDFENSSLPIRAENNRPNLKSVVDGLTPAQLQKAIHARMDYLSTIVGDAWDYAIMNDTEKHEDFLVYKANEKEISDRFIRQDLKPEYNRTAELVKQIEEYIQNNK